MKLRVWKWGAFAVLPVLLGAAILGVRWKQENPSTTSNDLQFRTEAIAVVRKFPAFVLYAHGGGYRCVPQRVTDTPKAELLALIEQTHITKKKIFLQELESYIAIAPSGYSSLVITLNLNNNHGSMKWDLGEEQNYDLHPASVRMWKEFLFSKSDVREKIRKHPEFVGRF